jgi:hypothetical protein
VGSRSEGLTVSLATTQVEVSSIEVLRGLALNIPVGWSSNDLRYA